MIIREKNYALFGLKNDLEKIKNIEIPTFVVNINPDLIEFSDLRKIKKDIHESFAEFLQSDQILPVYLLLGIAGTGKSTLLQLKYLEQLNIWKEGDPVPFYVNLASGTEIKDKWHALNKILNLDINLNFFIGEEKYPITFFLDSFDESRMKSNLPREVIKVFENNKKIKIILSCRTDYLNTETEYSWFKIGDLPPFKRYIVPIHKEEFNLEIFIEKFKSNYGEKNSNFDYMGKIKEYKLLDMIRTNFLAFMIMTTLPQLKSGGSYVSRYDIYHEFIFQTMKIEQEKLKNSVITELEKKFVKRHS